MGVPNTISLCLGQRCGGCHGLEQLMQIARLFEDHALSPFTTPAGEP